MHSIEKHACSVHTRAPSLGFLKQGDYHAGCPIHYVFKCVFNLAGAP